MGSKYIIKFLLFLLILGCSAQQPPDKLPNIPEGAKWYGGSEGGCWLLVEKTDSVNIFDITIYFDNTGEIWEKGNYKIVPKINTSVVTDSLTKYIEGFDGVTIHTKFPFKEKYQLTKIN